MEDFQKASLRYVWEERKNFEHRTLAEKESEKWEECWSDVSRGTIEENSYLTINTICYKCLATGVLQKGKDCPLGDCRFGEHYEI